jgi:hypothetical protein
VILAAVEILLPSMYPASSATIHPTASLRMIEIFFKDGDPKEFCQYNTNKQQEPKPDELR